MAKLISKKKKHYKVKDGLLNYLKKYGRYTELSIDYSDLLRYTNSTQTLDKHDEPTCWLQVSYAAWEQEDIFSSLIDVYAKLRAHGHLHLVEHLVVDRIELCLFGNSRPFRVRILNTLNDNSDYFYVKKADASRIYGLELEHILSPNRISFLMFGETLIIEHIYGIPGDVFIKDYVNDNFNPVRLAKEFVKFNERSFIRLLGDMHSANFVVDITLDIEDTSYRLRAIDFDQQSYEPKRKVYMPQYYVENLPYVKVGMEVLTAKSVKQYQIEERYLIHKRSAISGEKLSDLLETMSNDEIAPKEHIVQLREELAEHYKNSHFYSCQSMGELVQTSLNTIDPN